MSNDILVFKKLRLDADATLLERYRHAAMEKLHTLFPGDRVTATDATTLCIATDAPYAENGLDTYDIGLLDDEIPCMRNNRNEEVITFRVE